jgi:chemotaxis protein MotB
LRRIPQTPGEEKQKVPSYIVTFSDMVTLLLTFFVLLLTLAEVQDPELFNKGRDSFWESIRLCGLGALLGADVTLNLGADKVKYRTTEPETFQDRTIDEYREKLRRIFERINQSTTTLPSQIVGQQLHFSVTDVRFASGQAALDEAARESLSRFCMNVQQNVEAETSTLYVLGLAGDEATEMQQWTLSARRAQAVARFLQETLAKNMGGGARTEAEPKTPPWRVLSWGAGPGGNWAGQDSPDPGESQILIAVLKSGD